MSRESLNDKFIFYKVDNNFHIHHQNPAHHQHQPHHHQQNSEHQHQSTPSSFFSTGLNCCCITRKMIERNVVTPIVEPKVVAANCESFHNIESINYDVPFPCDIYEDNVFKIKPFRASFQERVKELRNAERVFVKQANKPLLPYIELGNQFEILNKHGQPIFFAIDATEWPGLIFEGVQPFNLMLLDYDYVEIFKIDGQPGHNRVKGHAVVKRNGKQVGRISQEDMFCSFTPTYNITGETGVKVIKIIGPEDANSKGMPSNPQFKVFLTDETSFVGEIKKQWLTFPTEDEEQLKAEEAYILSFHPDMDLKTKCLLLAAVFLLEYQFYHKSNVSGVSTACWIWFSILFFSLVVFILVGIYFIEEQHDSSSPTVEPSSEASGDLFELNTTDDPIGLFDLD
ncbi:unnamed protein product [Orchesella dallaii]|uniref:Phospholipid scramblase n=1 Tax=Orchesella dallaii TaxID=48710 RepID=A0ABP1Q516_9HEXA